MITAANNPDKSLADKKVAVEVSQYVWRSGVSVPRWEQWYNENTIKSSIFFVTFFGTAFFEQKNSGLFLYTYIQPTTVNQSYSYKKVINLVGIDIRKVLVVGITYN